MPPIRFPGADKESSVLEKVEQGQVALLGQGGSYRTSPVRMATPASRRPTPSSVTATM